MKELSELHTFYMICLHGWNHRLESLKYFIDIIQMVYRLNRKLDYITLLKVAVSHKTLKRIQSTLSIVYTQFPQLDDIAKLPFKKVGYLRWEYSAIRQVSSTSKNIKFYKNSVNFDLFDFDSTKQMFRILRRWILPPKEVIDSKLGYKSTIGRLLVEYVKLYKKRGHKVSRILFSQK